jgi:hypothetical protein
MAESFGDRFRPDEIGQITQKCYEGLDTDSEERLVLRSCRLVLSLVVALVVLSVGSAPALAQPSVQQDPPILFGADVGQRGGQSAAQAVAALEDQLGRTLDVRRWYSRWDDPQPASAVRDDVAHGRETLLSILPRKGDGSIVPWAGIAAGLQDATIIKQADGLRDLGTPVILIFHHEPEYASGFGTAADYVAGYRHYVAVFRAEGATNVQFAVAYAAGTFATTSINSWYPGDDVVDWIGADAYNFNACQPGFAPWRSLAQAAGAFYNWGSAHGKPLVLAEWGSAEDPNDPGRKAQWLADAWATMQNWPNIRAAAYFDSGGTCPDWWVDSSPASLQAFTTLANSAYAHGAASARLTPASATGPVPLAVTFDGSASTGTGDPTGDGITNWSFDPGDGSDTVSGTGQPPAALPHTYPPGTWTAALTVRDHTGQAVNTHASVLASPPPTITDGTAADITSASATVTAWIDPNGLPTTYYFRYGTTTAYGLTTPTQSLPTQTWSSATSASLTGLTPGTRYHWAVVASNAAGTTVSTDHYFDTLGPPTITVKGATDITTTSATLHTAVNPHGLPTSYWFDWGTTSSYGQASSPVTLPDTGSYEHYLSLPISELTPATVYHFRVHAQNQLGSATGPDQTFTTHSS